MRDENATWASDLTAVDPETLLKAKKLEDESKFFHSEDKGCSFAEVRVFRKNSKASTLINKCTVHNADCCKCGWEFGFHYGTASRVMFRGYNYLYTKK